jgi:Xaa-Pro aminopeptidase
MSKDVNEKISKLRMLIDEKGIDAYVIPSADNHQSEYVGEFFKSRAYITGFTGSAGTAVITKDKAGLWTDGRYFLQAEHQLEGSGVKLFKMGNPDVPTVLEYIEAEMTNNGKLEFDGRLPSYSRQLKTLWSFLTLKKPILKMVLLLQNSCIG